MKLTQTPIKDQDADARTQSSRALLVTALRLYSLHEQVETVERVSVGWMGQRCKAIIKIAIAL